MKTRTTIALLFAATLSIAMMLSACGGKKTSPKAPASSTATNTTAPSTPAAPPQTVTITAPNGTRVAAVSVAGQDVTIELGPEGSGRTLVGHMNANGKRKYQTQAGDPVAEVKFDADAFKVRAPDGHLLWKVKLKDDKVKVSDNEENAHPYVLKTEDDGFKVKDDETDIGKVKFHPDEGKVKVKDASGNEVFMSRATAHSSMYGVPLMARVPEAERAIIMAELLARGR